ncbi:MAG: hypothetical protein P8012_09990 [Desulfobacterales bacterium]
MSDSEDEKLKAEIDKIMIKVSKIIKKIETHESDNGRDSKQNRD